MARKKKQSRHNRALWARREAWAAEVGSHTGLLFDALVRLEVGIKSVMFGMVVELARGKGRRDDIMSVMTVEDITRLAYRDAYRLARKRQKAEVKRRTKGK